MFGINFGREDYQKVELPEDMGERLDIFKEFIGARVKIICYYGDGRTRSAKGNLTGVWDYGKVMVSGKWIGGDYSIKYIRDFFVEKSSLAKLASENVD